MLLDGYGEMMMSGCLLLAVSVEVDYLMTF